MKWDGCLEPLLWELRQYGPNSKGFRVRDAAAGDRPRYCRLFVACWCHDTRGLPLYTHTWQTPCHYYFCLWCKQMGFSLKEGHRGTCYMGAVRALSAQHILKRSHAEAFSDDLVTSRPALATMAKPQPTTHRGSNKRMMQAERMVQTHPPDSTQAALVKQTRVQ
jgi:hypothetical protein